MNLSLSLVRCVYIFGTTSISRHLYGSTCLDVDRKPRQPYIGIMKRERERKALLSSYLTKYIYCLAIWLPIRRCAWFWDKGQRERMGRKQYLFSLEVIWVVVEQKGTKAVGLFFSVVFFLRLSAAYSHVCQPCTTVAPPLYACVQRFISLFAECKPFDTYVYISISI